MSSELIPDDKLAELALAPKKTVGDEGSIEERPIDELLKVSDHINSGKASSPPFGMYLSRVHHGGTT